MINFLGSYIIECVILPAALQGTWRDRDKTQVTKNWTAVLLAAFDRLP